MSQKFWSGIARTIQPYTAGEQPRGGVLIKLNTNENAYPPSPRVSGAVADAVGRLRLYPPADSGAFREAVARFYGLPVEYTYAGNGSDEVLALAFQAYFNKGVPVAWPEVTYSFYPVYAMLYGLEARPLPMAEGLTVDVEALITHDGPKVLANPNAPTGIALTADTVERIAAAGEEQGFAVIVDEAYAAFSGGTAAGLIEKYPNLLVIGTLSKSHALAGLRAGYALGQPSLLEALWRIKDSFNSYPLGHLEIAAAAAALDDRAYFEEKTAAIVSTREKFSGDLRKLGFEVLPSSSNFVFTRLPGYEGNFLQAGLREKGILVRRFDSLGDYLRITIGTPEEMDKVIGELKNLLGK